MRILIKEYEVVIVGAGGGGLANCGGTIRNNLIFGNVTEPSGGGLDRCNGEIENNTV
ncbi:hypothetical protein HQ563_18095, partial [bacterium]|nr:hypothetical protein [bacterium]